MIKAVAHKEATVETNTLKDPSACRWVFFRQFLTRLSLRYKIITLVIAAIVLPSLLLSVIITSVSRRTLTESIFYQQQETLRRVADRITTQLERHQQLLKFNADIGSSKKQSQLAACRAILRQGEAFSEVAVLDNKGRETLKVQRGSAPAKALVNRSGRPEFREAMYGRSYTGQIAISGERHPYIILSIPLEHKAGVLVARMELDQVWQWISQVKIGESGYAFVVDRKGNLLAHPDTERVWAHSNFASLPIVKDYINKTEPASEKWSGYTDERGRKVVALYEAMPALGWAAVIQMPSQEVYRPIYKMYGGILFWTLIWIAAFSFLGYGIVQRIVRPITILQDGAHLISQGKLDIKLDIHTGDEIEELAHNFEKMALGLKQLNQLREDLVRMIVHDLKSPLSGIMGSLDFLGSGMLGDMSEEQQVILNTAKKSSENLLGMIQNLLDVAKMEEGKMDLHKENVDLRSVLSDRRTQLEALAATERKTITVESSVKTAPVQADRNLVERVINNLISNALHHTSGGGHIWLGLKSLPGYYEVAVSDDGVGVPKEYLDKIFEKFVQVKRAEAKLRTGAGLGLTFCRMAVEAHGGNIRVESELNKGSSFIFSLPL